MLRLVMDEELESNSSSPNIQYPFVSQLTINYEELNAQFVHGNEVILDKSGWRDDVKFLYHLTRVFKIFKKKSAPSSD